ncbi:hypothetical protein G4V62_17540 [Bacillaceae bacterium SIJ1]|uniref:CueP family metal-binding protein n=1 Tax=Litoribacterium kuwaitense TaxID=1398745 RepID=UPI0013EA1A56|nr:CueP family metal-binding protein [Litoribacterium kuwaitense]NGP46660.1 hypothetical protein [Litoribacterium kuwaitense]
MAGYCDARSSFLTACGGENADEATPTSETNIKELVNDYSAGQKNAANASITSEHLIVTEDNEDQTVYTLPEDEFFVSIAPYVNQTHPCTDHSLTGCQGEMVEESFAVYIEDQDGNVVVDEQMKTLANGFIDLWLPRDQTYQVVITHDGKEVASELSTFAGDGTCITTMQLT